MSYIEFKNIHKRFGDAHVLRGIDLHIEQGEFVTLLGPSGCGKSTLLRCFSGLETVSEGEIYLDGVNITNFTPKQRKIGMVFQQYSLFPNMTVRQNVAFGLQIQKKEKSFIEEKVKEVLDIVGLSEKIDQYPRQLSGGQQQRVAIGRALITRPSLILADEPTGNLDTQNSNEVIALLREASHKYEQTIIMITHNRMIAQTADRVLEVSDGVLTDLGRAQDVGGTSAMREPERKGDCR